MIESSLRRAAFVAALAASCCPAFAGEIGKNGDAPVHALLPAPPLPDGSVAAGGLGTAFVNCTDSRSLVTNAATTPIDAAKCAFTAPAAGNVLVIASGSLGLASGQTSAYEAAIRIAVDGGAVGGTTRYVDVTPDSGDGSDRTVAVSVLVPVTAGAHGFALTAQRFSTAGTVGLLRTSITAIFVPNGTAVTACGHTPAGAYNNATTTYSTVVGCTIDVPVASHAILVGSASATLVNSSPNEMRYGLSVDDATATFSNVERWLNVYANATDGQDETAVVSAMTSVGAGAHTFRMLARLSTGAGPARLLNPSLTVLVVPETSHAVCGSAPDGSFQTSNVTPTALASCPLNLAQAGSLFAIGNASLAMFANDAANEVEWQVRVGTSPTAPMPSADRWVNLYADAGGDGNDRPVFAQGHIERAAGPVNSVFAGLRAAGTGTASAADPTVIGLLLPPSSATLFADGFE